MDTKSSFNFTLDRYEHELDDSRMIGIISVKMIYNEE